MTSNAPLDGQGFPYENKVPPGITLTSFIPILKKLGSAVSLQNKRYHLKSDISDDSWASLQEFLRSVEELDIVLPDADSSGNTIADMTYIQLALIVHGPMAFFPFLKRLRLRDVDGSNSLLFLPLVLSRCLESVEVEGLNVDAGIVLESSLACHTTETLKQIIIRSPTFFPSLAIIQSCTGLEKVNFSSSLEASIYSYPKYLISHPTLKEYTLAAGQDTYSGSQTTLTVHAVRSPPFDTMFTQTTLEELNIHDHLGSYSAAKYLRRIAQCSSLKKFCLTVKDDTYSGSATALTLIAQNTKPLLPVIKAWETLKHLGIRDKDASMYPQYLEIVTLLPSLKSFDLIAGEERYAWLPPSLWIIAQAHPPPLSRTSIWKKVQELEISDFMVKYHNAEHYFNILLSYPSLKRFTIKCKEYHICQGTIETNIDSPTTPYPYIARLTLEPSSNSALPLPRIDIHQIMLTATTFQDFTHPFAEIASNASDCLRGLVLPSGKVLPLEPSLFGSPWPYLQKLTLPMDPTGPYISSHHISLPFLKVVAQQCPSLQSLQVLITLPSSQEVFTPPGGFQSCLLSHPLSSLSVGSLEKRTRVVRNYARTVTTIEPVYFIGPKLAGEIARYICALFPIVKIQTHERYSHDSWDAVNEMVQLFHSMLNELPRPSASLLDGSYD